jgi:hypothetical protein
MAQDQPKSYKVGDKIRVNMHGGKIVYSASTAREVSYIDSAAFRPCVASRAVNILDQRRGYSLHYPRRQDSGSPNKYDCRHYYKNLCCCAPTRRVGWGAFPEG